jgi:hypothetical protein
MRRDFLGSSEVASRNLLLHSGVTHGAKSPRIGAARHHFAPLQALRRAYAAALATANFRECLFHALG